MHRFSLVGRIFWQAFQMKCLILLGKLADHSRLRNSSGVESEHVGPVAVVGDSSIRALYPDLTV